MSMIANSILTPGPISNRSGPIGNWKFKRDKTLVEGLLFEVPEGFGKYVPQLVVRPRLGWRCMHVRARLTSMGDKWLYNLCALRASMPSQHFSITVGQCETTSP